MLLAVILAGCGLGPQEPTRGFPLGDDFSYMAEGPEGSDELALLAGDVAADGGVTGELQIVEIGNGAVKRDTTEFTGEVGEDGTAVFQGIGSDGSDVTATLEDGKAVLTLDKEVGIEASQWRRASIPAFNSAVQNKSRG